MNDGFQFLLLCGITFLFLLGLFLVAGSEINEKSVEIGQQCELESDECAKSDVVSVESSAKICPLPSSVYGVHDIQYAESMNHTKQLYFHEVQTSQLVQCLRNMSWSKHTSKTDLLDSLTPKYTQPEHEFALVLFHGSSWCPFSQAFEFNYSMLASGINGNGCYVMSVEALEYYSLNSRFGVHGLPTLVLFFKGDEISRFRGQRTLERIISWIQNASGNVIQYRNVLSDDEKQLVKKYYEDRFKMLKSKDVYSNQRVTPRVIFACGIVLIANLYLLIKGVHWIFDKRRQNQT